MGRQFDCLRLRPALIVEILTEIETANEPDNEDPSDAQAACDATDEGAEHDTSDCADYAVAIVANDGPNDGA